MTPFERGINALLKHEERLCVRMHQAFHDHERKTAYDCAVNTRVCINTFAKAYLAVDDAYKKFEAAMSDMHKTVQMKSFNTNLDQLTGWDGDGMEVGHGGD